MKLMTCAAALIAGLALASPVDAKTLRWASQGDPLTMDPHAQNEGLTSATLDHIYEPLIMRTADLKKAPALATEWKSTSPTTWEFKLRQGVTFHDGTPFTADDVVFSIKRAMAPTSNFKIFVTGVKDARKIDDHTVEVITSTPNPIIPDQFTDLRIMSKAWAEKNGAVEPQNYAAKEETFASRNANGTGPFMLKERQPDIRTVMVANPNWWGKGQFKGNVTEVVYQPIKSDPTRVAALLSGELDFVLDTPLQDVQRVRSASGLKVQQTNEVRVVFLGFDVGRDELLYSDVKGKNPFKDVRVRQAVAHAIDIEAIKAKVMRGNAVPTGVMISPGVEQYDAAIDKRPALDPAMSKKLLAEAGYPNGFGVTLDCPNNRYINDESICQAVVGMLAQVGIRASLNAQPRTVYFPKLQNTDTSFFMLGWSVPTYDAHYTLASLLATRDGGANGSWNYTGYSSAKMDDLVKRLTGEFDPAQRKAIVDEALTLIQADLPYLPLHHQVLLWSHKQSVDIPISADNRPRFRYAVVN